MVKKEKEKLLDSLRLEEETEPLLSVPTNDVNILEVLYKHTVGSNIVLDVSSFTIAIANKSLIIPGYPVDSYRQYYREEKRHIAKWAKRATPYWWN
jgi:hypothetical protein